MKISKQQVFTAIPLSFLLLTGVAFTYLTPPSPPDKPAFFESSIASAKIRAKTEKKQVFADFTAAWCANCKLMDKTVFTDPAVMAYIEQHYIPVKIDIDDFDGYAQKQAYNVDVLPTILVFDNKGKIAERVENTLTATELLALLKKHRAAAGSLPNTAAPVAITRPALPKTTPYSASPSPPAVDRSSFGYDNPPKRPAASAREEMDHIERIDDTRVAPSKTPSKPATPPVAASSNTAYVSFDANKDARYFGIQTGAFCNWSSINAEVGNIRSKGVTLPVLVQGCMVGGKKAYRVLVGRNANRQQAILLQKQLNSKGIFGNVKEYATLVAGM